MAVTASARERAERNALGFA
ncbi:hypothetical protein RSAG8_05907, partial [Rhizoctonia solani AG-8 WAC10335]